MNEIGEWNTVKLRMLEALADSQRAVAAILLAVAETSAVSRITASTVSEYLRALARYQMTIVYQLTGLEPRQPMCGTPVARPWLNDELIGSNGARRRHIRVRHQSHITGPDLPS